MSKRTPPIVPQRTLAIEYRPLDQLKPNGKNARFHSEQQIDQVVASYRQFGVVNPIIIDKDGNVIAGHARLLGAKRAGLKTIACNVIDDLNERQKTALALADNKIALNASWTPELLREQIIFASEEVDLTELGFEVAEQDVILSAGDQDEDDDVIPAPSNKPVTRVGDIWLAGALHRLGCGDSRDQAFLEAVMAGAMAAAAFHDPPYNVRINGHAGGKGKVRPREFVMASGELVGDEFEQFLVDTLGPSVRFSINGAVHYLCMDHRHAEELIAAAARLYAVRLNICVWNKSNAGMGSLYRSKHELVFVYRVGDAPHRNNVELGRHGRNRTNVWDYASVNTFGGSRRHDLALHPTVKPIALVADAIQDVTKRGEVVIDAFLGSGTTLLACERTGRVFRGVELDPAYVDVALGRFHAMTNIEPVLAETGEVFSAVAARRGDGEGEG